DPTYASPKINLGAMAMSRGDDAAAEKLLREAAAAPGARAEAHFNLALLGLRKGDTDLARTSLEKALNLRPEDPDILNNLGVCHLMRREYRKAEGYFDRATMAKPEFAQGYANLGLALNHLATESGDEPKLLVKAEAAFRKEIELRPDAPFAHYNLGSVLVTLGKVKEAETHFRRAIDLAPGHAEAYNNLGYCLSLSSKSKDADPVEELRCYKTAVELDPENVDAHVALGYFYIHTEGMQDYDLALQHWEQVRRFAAGDDGLIQEAKENISWLKANRLGVAK
ncbi:MAG: tetratricopeptide repeat protein, partial [Planctomycetota bacterium]